MCILQRTAELYAAKNNTCHWKRPIGYSGNGRRNKTPATIVAREDNNLKTDNADRFSESVSFHDCYCSRPSRTAGCCLCCPFCLVDLDYSSDTNRLCLILCDQSISCFLVTDSLFEFFFHSPKGLQIILSFGKTFLHNRKCGECG